MIFRRKDMTTNKLNTPYNNNVENKKKASKVNTKEYDYEFGSEYGRSREESTRSLNNNVNNRYEYEFGNEANVSDKDSPLARGANIANAFSQPNAPSADQASQRGNYGRYKEEYAKEQEGNTELNRYSRLKRKFQDDLRQNYNVEFSDDELIDDCCCGDCDNCPHRW